MKVVVLAGGISTERDVSLNSGRMIYNALKRNGHQVILLDVYLGYEGDTDDIFDDDRDWAAHVEAIGEQSPDIAAVEAMRADGGKSFFGPNVLKICSAADVVFIALHGDNGEDGKIQACFELMGIPYTGTGHVSSAIAMDKGISKDMFKARHIPTPAGIRLRKGEEEKERIPYPCVVKASCEGSSVGVFIVGNDEEYEQAKREAFRYGDELIIEQYISGREFAVGVLAGEALPVIEIAPKEGFYDYKNKYQTGSCVETCPAKLPAETAERMQRIALEVFDVLRLKCYARVDLRMNEAGDIYCLEANTLPGMTAASLLPQEAAAAGIGFEDLCEKILDQALN